MAPNTFRILNTIGLLVVLTLNYLANALPINGLNTGELSAFYPNYFVPAGFTFAIWGLIYSFLIGFIIYQWAGKNTDTEIGKIGWWFVISCAANSLWILAWHYQWVVLSLFIMLAILGSLIMIYQRLKIYGLHPLPAGKRWLIHTPFSIYLGWITVATIANVTTVFVNSGWKGGGIAEGTWAAIMIAVAALVGVIMLIRRQDLVYVGVLLWAFYGIYAKRNGLDDLPQAMFISLVGGSIALVGVAFWRILKKT